MYQQPYQGRGRGRGGFGGGRGGGGGGSSFRGRGGPPVQAHSRPPPDIDIKLKTNCFSITKLPQKEYYQYDAFSPEIKNFNRRQELIHKLQNVVNPDFFTPKCIFDGTRILFSPRRLQVHEYQDFTFSMSMSDRHHTRPMAGQRGVCTIRIAATSAEPVKTDHLKQLASGVKSDEKTTTATNLLQLLLCQVPNQNSLVHTARAFYSNPGAGDIGGGLELWRGFFHYKGGPVVDLAMSFLGIRNPRDLYFNDSELGFRKLKSFLRNLKIEIELRTGEKKIRAIRGLEPRAGEFEFSKDGETMTVQQYLQSCYGIVLSYPRMVGLILSPPNADVKVVVPMECCILKPGQIYKQKVPDDKTADVVRFATLRPGERLAAITGRGSRDVKLDSPVLSYANSEYLLEAGVQVSQIPLIITGRFLAIPDVKFRGAPITPPNGAWNLRNQLVSGPSKLECWVVVSFDGVSQNESQLAQVASHLKTACERLGMYAADVKAVRVFNEQAYERGLQEVQKMLMKDFEQGKKTLVVVICPDRNNPNLRQAVKYWSDIQTGIPTQCIRSSKLRQANTQYYENVALKINLRLGGRNFTVESPVFQRLKQAPFMIMGADVGHPSPGLPRPSVTSLVWSRDRDGTSYVTFTDVQEPRMEAIVNLGPMVSAAIDQFGRVNKYPPQKILFYRDGLSEGEFSTVAANEVEQIRSAVNDLWIKRNLKGDKPKLTYIVVGKRHHITFFPDKDSPADDGKGNCLAGFATNELKHPLTTDFYLQSHSAIQGTARSSHYTVIEDEIYNYNTSQLQELSFSLCHIYAKATRSVSIPAPVYYADLACSRLAYHLSPSSTLHQSDGVSSHGSDNGRGREVNIAQWKAEFKTVHNNVAPIMYFL
ncbi:hypothetical protein D9758_003502 [Tetrapyrgos nigripes]|uniref:Piwi domain-containing protein n=1 Tax=Tetrapyrgos nigripes TaxID=182062 RepID=A0A8H5LWB1_9AGAR|nr:hypothetical protein D9758_003502 [Tetrapyrgos nigripes]